MPPYISAALSCHRCGYDLRAHPQDAKCPECGELVAESMRLAAIPRRPAWRNSDPRWRRRMLAGIFVLLLLPFMAAVQTSGWATRTAIPNVFDYPGSLMLGHTFLFGPIVDLYKPLLFCIGLVLLFSKERGRPRYRLDWTRRWGILCSYLVFVLTAVQLLFIPALVLAGIAALCLSMPLKYQPGLTPFFVKVSFTYLRYGPEPRTSTEFVLKSFSSIGFLLACIPLFHALCSRGPKRLATILIAPLALFALVYLAEAARYCIYLSGWSAMSYPDHRWYFQPEMLVGYIIHSTNVFFPTQPSFIAFSLEAVKWCILLAIAIWLSIAQFTAWRQGAKRGA